MPLKRKKIKKKKRPATAPSIKSRNEKLKKGLSPEEIQEANRTEKRSKIDGEQEEFININSFYDEHWRGMPEYSNEDLGPYKSITVHFAKKKDLEAFSNLVKQRINERTLSIWYPEAFLGLVMDKRYIDAS